MLSSSPGYKMMNRNELLTPFDCCFSVLIMQMHTCLLFNSLVQVGSHDLVYVPVSFESCTPFGLTAGARTDWNVDPRIANLNGLNVELIGFKLILYFDWSRFTIFPPLPCKPLVQRAVVSPLSLSLHLIPRWAAGLQTPGGECDLPELREL